MDGFELIMLILGTAMDRAKSVTYPLLVIDLVVV